MRKFLDAVIDIGDFFISIIVMVSVSFLILYLATLLMGCAKHPVLYQPTCKDPPKLLDVRVVGNCVCGAELKNVITNRVNEYSYIEYLKIKGCK